jgi:hypothetical protein
MKKLFSLSLVVLMVGAMSFTSTDKPGVLKEQTTEVSSVTVIHQHNVAVENMKVQQAVFTQVAPDSFVDAMRIDTYCGEWVLHCCKAEECRTCQNYVGWYPQFPYGDPYQQCRSVL